MCGVAGCAVEPGRELPLDALERMADILHHRGPDDRAVEIVGNVGLAHTRLAIVDPGPSGRQPMHHPSGRWILSYNGEIYNHAELRCSLEGPFRGHSDTETLLHALAVWGEDALRRCNGIFAFAALDTARRKLLLARDHLGIKPLYVAKTPGAVWFASEVRALLAAGLPRRADPDVVWSTIVGGFPAGRTTPLAGIERVAGGTTVEIDLDTLGCTERRWYEPAEEVDPDLADRLSRTDPSQRTTLFVETLGSAIERQLMADVPVGVMCSGGLDSSLIAAVARRASPSIRAYNAALSGEVRDERRWAELLASELGVEFRSVAMTAEHWRAELVPSVWHFEYPHGFMGAVPIASIAGLARDDGVKVLLTGEGADEVFGGYAFRRWRSAKRFLSPARRLRLAVAYARSDGRHLPTRLRSRREQHRLRRSFGARADASPVRYALERGRRAYAHHAPPRRALEAELVTDLFAGSLPGLLNREDKNAMAASVEARVPFLDREVLSFALNLPVEDRIGPPPKRIVRAAARQLLPASFARRPKYTSMLVDPKRFIGRTTDPAFLEQGGLRDVLPFGDEAWRQLVRGSIDRRLFRLWVAEIWYRLFVCGQDVPGVEADLWRDGR